MKDEFAFINKKITREDINVAFKEYIEKGGKVKILPPEVGNNEIADFGSHSEDRNYSQIPGMAN
ncbi:MAG: hypothetical protein HQM13_21355 [SAR324 cluster bacterium]|nr:hypothetical protein [SAR324 cluster bacterium]